MNNRGRHITINMPYNIPGKLKAIADCIVLRLYFNSFSKDIVKMKFVSIEERTKIIDEIAINVLFCFETGDSFHCFCHLFFKKLFKF